MIVLIQVAIAILKYAATTATSNLCSWNWLFFNYFNHISLLLSVKHIGSIVDAVDKLHCLLWADVTTIASEGYPSIIPLAEHNMDVR